MITRQLNGTSKSCGAASKQDRYKDCEAERPDSKNGNGCCSKVTLAVSITGIENRLCSDMESELGGQ